MEEERLLPQLAENIREARRPPQTAWRNVAGAIALVSSLCIMVLVSSSFLVANNDTPPTSRGVVAMAKQYHQRKCLGEVCVFASNEDERRLGRPIANGRHRNVVVQIFRPTKFEVAAAKTECTFESNDLVIENVMGCSADVYGSSVGVFDLAITKSTTISVEVKYVRREIRDLDEEDRRAYFDAMSAIYQVSQEEGAAKYGEKYHSIAWLVREHLYGSARKDCDHWHDDAGFVNHHVGITMQFEQSIQAVDSRVAAHYWDYTIDEARLDDWTESDMFQDSWFGTVKPENDLHCVDEGRWAYTSILSRAGGSWTNITNPYGLLRSPWNTNPTPYVTRNNYVYGALNGAFSIPSCVLFACVLAKAPDMGTVSSDLNGILHGPVHIMTGGLWSVDPKIFQYAQDSFEQHAMNDFLLASKFMWRQGLVRCPEFCDLGTPEKECMCQVNPILQGQEASDILNRSGVLTLFDELPKIKKTERLRWDKVLSVLAHFGYAGEMYTSAAPYDPLFWPLHGMAERYVQAIRHYIEQGESSIREDWSYYHPRHVVSDTNVVCDWSEVTSGSLEMPKCRFGETCPGHKIDDLLPFEKILIGTNLSHYTNREFYDMTGPFSEHLPYVYDQLTRWTECGDLKQAASLNSDTDYCEAFSVATL